MSDRRNTLPARVDPVRALAKIDAFDKLPPHAIDHEMCLIASMMLDREFAIEAVGATNGDAFYLTDHAILFNAIGGLILRNRPVDAVILRDELKRLGQLDEIGGSAYLAQILGTVPSAAHGREYLRRVIEKAGLRALIGLSDDLTRRSFAGQQSPEEIAETAMSTLLSIVARGGADRIVTMAQAVEQFRAELASDRVPFVPTGLAELDEEIGGIGLGKMMILGARPSVGKTLVAKVMLRNIARRGVRCGLVSIEEDRQKITGNYASSITGIDNRIIAHRAMSPGQRAQVEDALDDLAQLPIVIADEPVRLQDVVAAVTAMKVRHKCDVVIVDHLHLIGFDGDESRADQIRQISGALKACFKRLRVGGVVLCQLNRGGEDRPTLQSLREGGSLEADGDVIVMLHSEDYHRKQRGDPARDHKLELLLQKNKDGRTCDIPFFYEPAKFRVSSWDARHGNDVPFTMR